MDPIVRHPLIYTVACLMTFCLSAVAPAQEKFKTYDGARSEGGRLLRNQQLAEAQAPLEAALRLAPDDKARLEVYQALASVYRILPEIDKKLEANEFVIRHTERRPGRSLASRDLVSFLHQRGKIDVAVQRYEARLKEEPKDVAALSVLSEVYQRIQRDAGKAAAYAERLEAVDREIARGVAQRMEKAAEASPRTAASQLKDAAQLWLEAGEKKQALAAAKRSADGPPETRSELLTFYWHDGLGDVFLAAAEPKQAVAQFEKALAVARNDS